MRAAAWPCWATPRTSPPQPWARCGQLYLAGSMGGRLSTLQICTL